MSAKSKKSKQLVIDASVAQASGGLHAVHLCSKHCRDFLQTVLEVCHRMVLTPEVKKEWDEHQSAFARQWRVSMFARKKVELVDSPRDDALRATIDTFLDKQRERTAVEKDLHLIEGALAGDRIVASLDDKMRAILHRVSTDVRVVADTVWLNPDSLHEQAVTWLEDGCPTEESLLLGSPAPVAGNCHE